MVDDEIPTRDSLCAVPLMDVPRLFECTGNDVEFMMEVLQDVNAELSKHGDEMKAGYTEKDFDKIFLAAHALRGTCNYLSLDRLLDVVHGIRDSVILCTDRPRWQMKYKFPNWTQEEVLEKLEILFPLFDETAKELIEEIEKFKAANPTATVPETDPQ
jgi:hypothetical protein